jgi:hypothetical protein
MDPTLIISPLAHAVSAKQRTEQPRRYLPDSTMLGMTCSEKTVKKQR